MTNLLGDHMTLNSLRAVLRDGSSNSASAAAWEVFDLALRTADAVMWQDGYDELQASAAAEACAVGRALLRPPVTGTPVPLPTLPESFLAECADLLDLAAQRLEADAARCAAGAARCLRATREAAA